MRATRAGAVRLLGCPLRARGDEQRLALCLARTEARVWKLLDHADRRAAEKGFDCPAGIDALALAVPYAWPLRFTGEHVGSTTGECARQRLRASRRYAAAHARCVTAVARGHYENVSECSRSRRLEFLRDWQGADASGDCTPGSVAPAAPAADRIVAEIDESAARVTVRCGDGYRGGFEECDDGNVENGDGCSANCRRETCGRVGDEVLCIACPSDSRPTDDYSACRCPDGYEGDPGACTDIDECATDEVLCPPRRPCVNLEGTWACSIACTADAFHQALAECGAPSGAIAFQCSDDVIRLAVGEAPNGRRVECDGLTIDGAGRNITFELDPPCWRTPVAPEDCPGGLAADGTCACPDVDSGDVFLSLRGRGNVVRDLTVRGFFDGMPTRGRDNLVENVRFERMCDDAFGSVGDGVGNTFRHLSVRDGCDKCSENTGSIAATDPDPRLAAHYNGILEDIDFNRCRTPVRMSIAGRFLLRDLRMRGADSEFPCDGPRFTTASADHRLVIRMEDSVVEGCRRGLRFGGMTEGILRGNRVVGGGLRGLRVAGSSLVSAEGNAFLFNGGEGSSEPGFGGVAILDNAGVDLGGEARMIDGRIVRSGGRNSICSNLGPDGADRDVEGSTGVRVSARGNWWCGSRSPADRVLGAVDVEPILDRAPLDFRR
jgi:cysteine-rich repeat protein